MASDSRVASFLLAPILFGRPTFIKVPSTFHNLDKYTFVILTNTFYNLDKNILQFWQIYLRQQSCLWFLLAPILTFVIVSSTNLDRKGPIILIKIEEKKKLHCLNLNIYHHLLSSFKIVADKNIHMYPLNLAGLSNNSASKSGQFKII